ncbi:MAG TPA: GIY-YIG nuclease family protein [Thermodesulfovibrionales bacterium]|nr:GIY-YIG nuclease family protein [Thermodesulfovibrionales bacterium]
MNDLLSKGFVYVLRCSDNKLYTGSTRDIEERLAAHGKGKVRTTKSRRPVELVYKEEFEEYSAARKRELYLKSGVGREWLKSQLEGWPSGLRRRS